MNQTAGSHKTVRVFVVVPPRTLLLDVAGPIEVLRKANLEQSDVQFEVTFIGPSETAHSSIGLMIANIEPLPESLPDDAMVIISGSADIPLGGVGNSGEEDDALEAQIVSWMRRVIRPGIRLVSICSGALLAARAGLLDGYDCTTHHMAIEELNRLAPTSRVLQNRLFVEDRDRLTSAGITAGIDLMLHIVAEIAGHALALSIARYLVVYLRRSGETRSFRRGWKGAIICIRWCIVHRMPLRKIRQPAGRWNSWRTSVVQARAISQDCLMSTHI